MDERLISCIRPLATIQRSKYLVLPKTIKRNLYRLASANAGANRPKLDLQSSKDQDDCFDLVNKRAKAKKVVNEAHSTTVANICG